jgi:lipopolysaccharide transport system permease protein
MTRRELAARHAGSVAGAGWIYAQPLLTLLVYYLIFDVVFKMRLGEGAPTRAAGAFLIAGLLPWMAFGEALSRAMHSLVEAGSLLQKNPLPPVLFPARAVAATIAIYLPLMLLMALAYTPLHGGSVALLVLPVLLLGQLLLCLVYGYLLAILAAAMRDVLQLAGFALSLGVFLSPVLFPLSMFPEGFRWVLWLNPMTPLILGFQSILLAGAFPDTVSWLALALWLLGGLLVLDRLVERSKEKWVDWL